MFEHQTPSSKTTGNPSSNFKLGLKIHPPPKKKGKKVFIIRVFLIKIFLKKNPVDVQKTLHPASTKLQHYNLKLGPKKKSLVIQTKPTTTPKELFQTQHQHLQQKRDIPISISESIIFLSPITHQVAEQYAKPVLSLIPR